MQINNLLYNEYIMPKSVFFDADFCLTPKSHVGEKGEFE